jgi:hypothetical protein
MTGLTIAFDGNNRSFRVSSDIRMMAVNCISLITVCKITHNSTDKSEKMGKFAKITHFIDENYTPVY